MIHLDVYINQKIDVLIRERKMMQFLIGLLIGYYLIPDVLKRLKRIDK